MTFTALPAQPVRVPSGRLALWLLIASEIVMFGGLVACYVMFRLRNPEWAAFAANTSTPLGALNTLVLLTSSLTVVLAHAAAGRRDLGRMTAYLSTTIALGGVFLVVKAVEYTTEFHHHCFPWTNTFWSFYFTMTGLHALHVIAGMTAMLVVMLGCRKTGRNLHRVEMAGLYWHFVDVVWIFLFPLLYVAK